MGFSLFRQQDFFGFFERSAENVVEGCRLLEDLLQDFRDVETKVRRIKDIEHRGDEVTHEVLQNLERNFVTPFDREDIHHLATRLDDILDSVDASASCLHVYVVDAPRPHALTLSKILLESAGNVRDAIRLLRDRKRSAEVQARCVEIHRLENEGDHAIREAVRDLFQKERNAIDVIKWKDIYEDIETAIDRCEDVANVLEGVVIKHA